MSSDDIGALISVGQDIAPIVSVREHAQTRTNLTKHSDETSALEGEALANDPSELLCVARGSLFVSGLDHHAHQLLGA